MPRRIQPPLSPDDLDRLWDAIITSIDSSTTHDSQAEEASIIASLHAAAPTVSSERLDALRRRIDRAAATGTATPDRLVIAPGSTGTRSNHVPPQASAIGTQSHRFGRFATAASLVATATLVVAIVAAMALAGPVRNYWQSGNDQHPENGSGTGQSIAEFPPHGGRGLVSILVRPGDVPGELLTIGLWEVTMPPGSVLIFPLEIQQLGHQAVEAWVDDGAVIVGTSGFEHEVETGNTTGVEPAPDYYRNAGDEPASLLLLAPLLAPETFPLRFTDWPGSGTSIALSRESADYSDSQVRLFSSVDLDPAAAAQVRVTAGVDTYASGDIIDPWAGPVERPVSKHSVTVWEGEATVNPAAEVATPQVRQVLASGDTFLLDSTAAGSALLEATGPGNLTLLTLESAPWSSNPTLDQTVDAVAPFWGNWTVPATGEVNLVIRSLTLDPGARYELPSDAGIFYLVPDTELVATNVSTGATGPLGPGSIVAQLPGNVIRFENESADTVRLVQAIVFDGALDDVTAPEPTDGIVPEVLVQVSGNLPAGEASLMLEAHEYNGENDGGASGSGSPSLVLLAALDGPVQVRRDGGDATVVKSPGADAVQPALGDGVVIEPEGYMLALPESGWSMTGALGAAGTGLVFSISPMVSGNEVAPATPELSSAGTVTLHGNPGACDVQPLTGDDVDTLLATPAVNDDPLARSARNRTDGIVDAETSSAISDMLQGYVNCAATGDYSRTPVFYSDQAFRESETMRDLIDAGHDVGNREGLVAIIEDIVIFPNGRAGARAVIDGEATYLTFVLQNGSWVIDVWDDSEGGPPINASPVAA